MVDGELGWLGNPDYPEHDQQGFRNRDVPKQATVVALGDSQTYGTMVAADEAWPEQLEKLGVGPVYNMGIPGWGPAQLLLELDEALELEPDHVVTALNTGNDLVDAYTFVYDRSALRKLRTNDPATTRALKAAGAYRFDGDLLPHESDASLADPEREPPEPRSLAELFTLNSKLYGLAHGVRRAYDRNRRRGESRLDDGDIPFANDRFATVLTPGYRGEAVNLQDPRVAEGLRLTLEMLSTMNQHSTAAGTRLTVLLLPTKELTVSEVVTTHLAPVPEPYTRLVQNEAVVRQQLQAQLAARQIAVVDALPPLRSLLEQGTLPYSVTRDGHFNPAGQQAVAEHLLRSLMSQPQARAGR
jgi:lysophospholipase L1-like esterase